MDDATGYFSGNQRSFKRIEVPELENSYELIDFLNECEPRLIEQWVLYVENKEQPGHYTNAGSGYSHNVEGWEDLLMKRYPDHAFMVMKRWELSTKWVNVLVESKP